MPIILVLPLPSRLGTLVSWRLWMSLICFPVSQQPPRSVHMISALAPLTNTIRAAVVVSMRSIRRNLSSFLPCGLVANRPRARSRGRSVAKIHGFIFFHTRSYPMLRPAASIVGFVGPRANGSVLNEQERSATRFESEMTSSNVGTQVEARLSWLNNPPNEVQKVKLTGRIGHFGQTFGVARHRTRSRLRAFRFR